MVLVLGCSGQMQQHQQMHVPQNIPQMQMPQMGQQQQQGVYQQQMPPQQFAPQQGIAVPQQPGMQQGMIQQQQPIGAPQVTQGGSFIREKAHVQDRAHIQEHLSEMLGPNQDMSKMSEEELQFHYFKLHDNDDNNKLDGLELIKSLIHWHVEESKHLAQQGQQQPTPHGTTKLFTDAELQAMIDPILQMDDRNRDGFIDYPEFVAAQKSRGF